MEPKNIKKDIKRLELERIELADEQFIEDMENGAFDEGRTK